jgi:hypothetical protein
VFLEGKDVVAENDEFIGVENWRMRIAARARPKKEVPISLYFANQVTLLNMRRKRKRSRMK